jgi:2-phospho-L-lactate guanylyltransferase
MLEDVLTALHDSRFVDQITVLTPDRRVMDYATPLGAKTLIDSSDRGINEAIADATEYEMDERDGTPLLILPVDVPLVKSKTIDYIIGRIENSSGPLVVISPSTTKGTNALLRNPPNIIPTRYGIDSFEAHVQEAKERKIRLEIYRSEDLEIDLDTPPDLYKILSKGNSTRTSSFLESILREEKVSARGSCLT